MNKLTKKTVTVVLAGSFLLSMATAGFAQTVTTPVATDPTAVIEQVQAPTLSQMLGTIVDVQEKDGVYSIEVKSQDGLETMIFHTSDKTFFVDGVTGLPMDFAKRTTEMVKVYYGPAMTMSLPAQSTATAIIGNVKEGDSIPHYAKVEAVETLKDGSVLITTDGGSRLVTLGKDMPISPFKTKNIEHISSVIEGTELMLWYDIMTLSLPAQANADKAVVLLQPIEMHADTQKAIAQVNVLNGQVTVEGTAISGNAYDKTAADGTVYTMVPARAVAQALGYEVLWADGTVTIKLKDGAQSATYTVGSTDYGANRMRVVLGVAPENIDGVTYVPMSFFSEALNITVSGK